MKNHAFFDTRLLRLTLLIVSAGAGLAVPTGCTPPDGPGQVIPPDEPRPDDPSGDGCLLDIDGLGDRDFWSLVSEPGSDEGGVVAEGVGDRIGSASLVSTAQLTCSPAGFSSVAGTIAFDGVRVSFAADLESTSRQTGVRGPCFVNFEGTVVECEKAIYQPGELPEFFGDDGGVYHGLELEGTWTFATDTGSGEFENGYLFIWRDTEFPGFVPPVPGP